MSSTVPSIHQGDTFSRAMIAHDAAGQPMAIPTDAVITAVLGDMGLHKLADLTVTVGDQVAAPGLLLLSAADTSGWPVGYLTVQLCLLQNGAVQFEDVRKIQVKGVIK
jgi:hypothetical protein